MRTSDQQLSLLVASHPANKSYKDAEVSCISVCLNFMIIMGNGGVGRPFIHPS
jgi:hypothetical protein